VPTRTNEELTGEVNSGDVGGKDKDKDKRDSLESVLNPVTQLR
jgi:hypothetical protein